MLRDFYIFKALKAADQRDIVTKRNNEQPQSAFPPIGIDAPVRDGDVGSLFDLDVIALDYVTRVLTSKFLLTGFKQVSLTFFEFDEQSAFCLNLSRDHVSCCCRGCVATDKV